jgi:hypothetical protein
VSPGERADFITQLYAVRSELHGKQTVACCEHWLRVAAHLADARQSVSDAIAAYDDVRDDAAGQQRMEFIRQGGRV